MSNISEQVTPGHPDKVADFISDSILDAVLEQDPAARVAVETLVTGSAIVLAGEISADADVDYSEVALSAVDEVGYDSLWWPQIGSLDVIDLIEPQSPNLNSQIRDGAGDQGMMYGYACREDGCLPRDYLVATEIARKLFELHRRFPSEFGPDGKATAVVSDDGELLDVSVSLLHSIPLSQARKKIAEVLRSELNIVCPITVNPSGNFTVGGPGADTGLTGRKIIADTYGGRGRHGGGAFSGKDASKVDRTAAYYARQLAITALENSSAYEVEVQLGYAIGDLQPRSIRVCLDGKNISGSDKSELFTPAEVAALYELTSPVHSSHTFFGHFTDPDAPWNQPM